MKERNEYIGCTKETAVMRIGLRKGDEKVNFFFGSQETAAEFFKNLKKNAI